MMSSGVVSTPERRDVRKRRREVAPKSKTFAASTSLLRSIRLCDEASLLLRKAGWCKGDLQRRLSALARDTATLSSVDVLLAKDMGERERHRTRTTSARIEHDDYGRLFAMAAAGGVSVWVFLNQAIIDKYGRASSL